MVKVKEGTKRKNRPRRRATTRPWFELALQYPQVLASLDTIVNSTEVARLLLDFSLFTDSLARRLVTPAIHFCTWMGYGVVHGEWIDDIDL